MQEQRTFRHLRVGLGGPVAHIQCGNRCITRSDEIVTILECGGGNPGKWLPYEVAQRGSHTSCTPFPSGHSWCYSSSRRLGPASEKLYNTNPNEKAAACGLETLL